MDPPADRTAFASIETARLHDDASALTEAAFSDPQNGTDDAHVMNQHELAKDLLDHEKEEEEGHDDDSGNPLHSDDEYKEVPATSTIVGQPLQDLMQQYDPSTMQLTPQEHQWAVNIKNAIEALPDLDGLSDFWYAQLGIVTEGNVEDAVEKVYRMQEHKKEYGIMDTLDQGVHFLPAKAAFLSVDYNLATGGYILAFDGSIWDGAAFTNADEMRTYKRRAFYSMNMVNCDFVAVRAGVTILVELEGYKMTKGKSLDLNSWNYIWRGVYAYPRRLNQVKLFNGPSIFNIMASVAKRTLPKDITNKFQFGAKCPMGRLDKLYKLPTPEIAHARLQGRMMDLIRKRYINERCFTLEQQRQQLEPPAPVANNK